MVLMGLISLTTILFSTNQAEAQRRLIDQISRDISAGLNERDEQSTIADRESTVLKNAILRAVGKASKRGGSTLTLNLTESGGIAALGHYYKQAIVTGKQ